MGVRSAIAPDAEKAPPSRSRPGERGRQYREETSRRLIERDVEQRVEGALKALNYRVFFGNSYSVWIRSIKCSAIEFVSRRTRPVGGAASVSISGPPRA